MKKTLLSKALATLTLALSVVGCSKPYNDLEAVRQFNLESDLCEMYAHAVVPEEPLTLEMIIELALEQNLEILLQQHQLEIQTELATSETLKMLPTLTYNNTISERSNSADTRSQNLATGVLTGFSTSDERRVKRFDMELAISLLDFGLAFYRARQEHNRELILLQQHIRIRQNLVKSVIQAYWKTMVALHATESAQELIGMAEERQALLQKRTARGTVGKIEGLQNEQTLIEMQMKLHAFRSEYQKARTELAALMGLHPDCAFELKPVEMLPVKMEDFDICELEEQALLSRPELFEQDLESQIVADETRAAFLQMFPNVRLFTTHIRDDDFFFLHNSWWDAGIRTTFDLLRLPSTYHNYKSTKAQEDLVRETRLSLSVGIITQVRLAHLSMVDAMNQYELARDLYRTKWKLLEAAKKERALGAFRASDIHSLQVDTLFSKVNSMKAYAQLQVALERLANTIGRPLYFSSVQFQRSDIEASLRIPERVELPLREENTALVETEEDAAL